MALRAKRGKEQLPVPNADPALAQSGKSSVIAVRLGAHKAMQAVFVDYSG